MTVRRLVPFHAATLLLLTACAPATYQTANVSAPGAAPIAHASTPAPATLSQRLDSLMRASFPADQPGAAAIVVRNGEVLLRGGYGMADLELGVALRPEHSFRIGSVTKQFTGAAILMLAKEGKLTLDDRLTRFFPDYPTGGRTVTVQHLLAHTSGIRSYTDMPEWEPTIREDRTVDEMIALFRDEPFDFEPGSRWAYSNSGYFLLGAIIEQVSGMSYADFIANRIFGPLGMDGSSYDITPRITPNRVRGYSRNADGWVNADFISMTHPYAAGSLLSTVDDLARWDAAITSGELLSEASWAHAFEPVPLNDGRSTGYAAGWLIGRMGEYRTHEHDGGIDGFSSNTMRVPDAGLFVAVLTNADRPLASPTQVTLRLADIVLGGVLEPPAVAVSTDRLREYVGEYRIDGTDDTRTITLEGERLLSQRSGGNALELRAIGDDVFLFPGSGTRLRFVRTDGRVSAMIVEPRAGMGDRATRTPAQ